MKNRVFISILQDKSVKYSFKTFYMTSHELHAKLLVTKRFLQQEMINNKLQTGNQVLNFREIGTRMDMIHEAERVGVRNLGERQSRKLTKMISELEEIGGASLN